MATMVVFQSLEACGRFIESVNLDHLILTQPEEQVVGVPGVSEAGRLLLSSPKTADRAVMRGMMLD